MTKHAKRWRTQTVVRDKERAHMTRKAQTTSFEIFKSVWAQDSRLSGHQGHRSAANSSRKAASLDGLCIEGQSATRQRGEPVECGTAHLELVIGPVGFAAGQRQLGMALWFE